MSQLYVHTGGREAPLEEVLSIEAPPPEGRWYPISHGAVLNRVRDTLDEAGFVVAKERYALSKDNHRFFAVLDMQSQLSCGVALSVGVRNSTDKKFPIGFCAGSRTFVCDNLAFSADLLLSRRHTKNGVSHFSLDIAAAMPKLSQFREVESFRIERLKVTAVSDVQAESFILRAYDRGIISSLQIKDVLKEYRSPSFEEFAPRTLWSLTSAFTTVLGREGRQVRNPNAYVQTTMRLNHLVTPLVMEAKGNPYVEAVGMDSHFFPES